ncbi:MAG: hypothetical protein GX963_10000 [Bacteroidales bacterium]|nr:hypothetical protein [Bacteroidales bacterium]
MKRYNLSEIMTTAHRTYKYVGKKQGETFGEVLKSTWMLAKVALAMSENEEKARQASIKKASEKREIVLNTNSSFNSLDLKWEDMYVPNSRGYMGSQYCGD